MINTVQLEYFAVISARNLPETFEIIDFSEDQIDLVINDIIMPFKNGRDMVK